MINIVFEGSTGSGKTTILRELVKVYQDKGLKVGYTNDIDETTPLYAVIKSMFEESALVTSDNKFSTIQYETLVQAADYLFLRERIYSQNNDINLLDRNFCSVFSYQSVLMEKELSYGKKFMENILSSILLGEKNVDLMVFFNPPIEKSLKFSEIRDGRNYTEEEKNTFIEFNNKLKTTIETFYPSEKLLVIDGDYTIEDVVDLLKLKIDHLLSDPQIVLKKRDK